MLTMAIMPLALAEEQVLAPEVEAAFDRLSQKMMDESKKTRDQVKAKDGLTAGAITKAGERTANAVTEVGKAIENNTGVMDQRLREQTASVGKVKDAQGLVQLSIYFGFTFLFLFLSVLVILSWRMSKKSQSKLTEAIDKVAQKLEPQQKVVTFNVGGMKHEYALLVDQDGRYLTPSAIAGQSPETYQDWHDARRVARVQLNSSAELCEQEFLAKRLRPLEPTIHLVDKKAEVA